MYYCKYIRQRQAENSPSYPITSLSIFISLYRDLAKNLCLGSCLQPLEIWDPAVKRWKTLHYSLFAYESNYYCKTLIYF